MVLEILEATLLVGYSHSNSDKTPVVSFIKNKQEGGNLLLKTSTPFTLLVHLHELTSVTSHFFSCLISHWLLFALPVVVVTDVCYGNVRFLSHLNAATAWPSSCITPLSSRALKK